MFQMPISAISSGMLRSVGASRKWLSIACAFEHRLEGVHADGERQRKPDRTPQRKTAANPVPELEQRIGEMPKRRARSVGGDGDELAAHRFVGVIAGSGKQPVACGVRVVDRLQRREGLAGDDEQGRARIELFEARCEIGGVEIGNVVDDERRMGMRIEGDRRHARTEVGTADADKLTTARIGSPE